MIAIFFDDFVYAANRKYYYYYYYPTSYPPFFCRFHAQLLLPNEDKLRQIILIVLFCLMKKNV